MANVVTLSLDIKPSQSGSDVYQILAEDFSQLSQRQCQQVLEFFNMVVPRLSQQQSARKPAKAAPRYDFGDKAPAWSTKQAPRPKRGIRRVLAAILGL